MLYVYLGMLVLAVLVGFLLTCIALWIPYITLVTYDYLKPMLPKTFLLDVATLFTIVVLAALMAFASSHGHPWLRMSSTILAGIVIGARAGHIFRSL